MLLSNKQAQSLLSPIILMHSMIRTILMFPTMILLVIPVILITITQIPIPLDLIVIMLMTLCDDAYLTLQICFSCFRKYFLQMFPFFVTHKYFLIEPHQIMILFHFCLVRFSCKNFTLAQQFTHTFYMKPLHVDGPISNQPNNLESFQEQRPFKKISSRKEKG